MPKDLNDPLVKKERKDIFETISRNLGKNVTSIDTVYFDVNFRFGNQLLVINKLIFYCELIGCKKIILNPEPENALYIKNKIIDEKFNLTIEVINNNTSRNEFLKYSILNYNYFFYYSFHNIKVENRLNVIKNEMLRNLPKVSTDQNDLYIHIRGGDIFMKVLSPNYSPSYAQYPLCFYTKIIENNNFKNIYIISQDKLNPIVDELLKKYSNAIYRNNTLEVDISNLVYAYNIIGSVSSFIISIIKLNDNLKNYWEYDIYQIEKKFIHIHHSLYNFRRNYTIFRMEPSEQYKKRMYIWTRSDEQIQIMLNDTCPNNFKKINPNI